MKNKKTFFSEQLKKIMFEQDITQQELASRLGVTQTIISRWVRGSFNPNMNSIKKISSVLGVPVTYLMDEDNNKSTKNKNEETGNINTTFIMSFIKENNKRFEAEISFLKKEIELLKVKINKK